MALNITNKENHLEIEDTTNDTVEFIGKNLREPYYDSGALIIRDIETKSPVYRISDLDTVGTVADDVNGNPTAPTTIKILATTIAGFFFA